MKMRRKMMNNLFPQYTTDYISGVMSLRKPQVNSLKILEEIMTFIHVQKGMNLKAALGGVHALYPICSDFERDFMSFTFALATGVGKTRLMGAFIAYLYTQHGVKNFLLWHRILRFMKNSRKIYQTHQILNMYLRG